MSDTIEPSAVPPKRQQRATPAVAF